MKPSEKINLGATILGPIVLAGLIGWVSWSVNAKLDLRQAAAEKDTTAQFTHEHQFVEDNFVSNERFNQVQDATNKHLESIDHNISSLAIDMATMRGRMDKNQN